MPGASRCPGQLASCSWKLPPTGKHGTAVKPAFQAVSVALWHGGADLASIYHFAGSKKLHVIIISHSLSAPLSLLLGKAFSALASLVLIVSVLYLYIYFCQNFAMLGKQSWLVTVKHVLLRPSPPCLSQKNCFTVGDPHLLSYLDRKPWILLTFTKRY